MRRDREELLRLVEERLAAVSRWLAARRVAGERHFEQLRAHLESVRRELRKDTAQSLARARAAVDEMERDFEIPPPRASFPREELRALIRHLRLTAALRPHLSNLDDPGWRLAHEKYERSWDELARAFETPATSGRRDAVRRGGVTGR